MNKRLSILLLMLVVIISMNKSQLANAAILSPQNYYYYDKYAVNNVYKESGWVYDGYYENSGREYGYSAYVLNQSTGLFELAGTQRNILNNRSGEVYWFWGSDRQTLYRDDYDSVYGQMHGINTRRYIRTVSPTKVTERGSLIQSGIKAPDGTYPNDGIFSDGYWYIKTSQAVNIPPTGTVNQINQTPASNQTTFSITGTAQDSDGDTLLISATIAGVIVETLVTNTSTPQPWTLTWDKSQIPEGNYSNIQVTISDGK